jgi:thiamine biosynthesis lipoprotein ApbE
MTAYTHQKVGYRRHSPCRRRLEALSQKPIMPSDSAVKVSLDDRHEQPHQGARYHHLFDVRRGEPQS